MDLPEIARMMKENDIRLVTAESCTAGLIASRMADLPGAGGLLDSAFVVYSAAAKQRCLAVRAETIARHNLTSEEVAVEMALGALRNSSANLALANTGVVDDTDPSIPAGTQCFAWVYRRESRDGRRSWKVYSETRRFHGERNEIRLAAAEHALRRIPLAVDATRVTQDLCGRIELPMKKWPPPE